MMSWLLNPFNLQCSKDHKHSSVPKRNFDNGFSFAFGSQPFQTDFFNPQMLSFPNLYNTMGSKMDGLAVREHFLSKNAAFWAARFSDHLTSERSSTHNFKD